MGHRYSFHCLLLVTLTSPITGAKYKSEIAKSLGAGAIIEFDKSVFYLFDKVIGSVVGEIVLSPLSPHTTDLSKRGADICDHIAILDPSATRLFYFQDPIVFRPRIVVREQDH